MKTFKSNPRASKALAEHLAKYKEAKHQASVYNKQITGDESIFSQPYNAYFMCVLAMVQAKLDAQREMNQLERTLGRRVRPNTEEVAEQLAVLRKVAKVKIKEAFDAVADK